MSAELRISAEDMIIEQPFTASFEKVMLDKQLSGKTLLWFNGTEDNKAFTFIFGQVRENMEIASALRSAAVAPWNVYFFGGHDGYFVRKGEVFSILRLVEDYADVFSLGDPVEMIDIGAMSPLGRAEVVALHKTRICDIPLPLLGSVYPHVSGYRDAVRQLSKEYGQEVSENTVVSLVRVRATTDVGEQPTLYERVCGFGETMMHGIRRLVWSFYDMREYGKGLLLLFASTLATLVWMCFQLFGN